VGNFSLVPPCVELRFVGQSESADHEVDGHRAVLNFEQNAIPFLVHVYEGFGRSAIEHKASLLFAGGLRLVREPPLPLLVDANDVDYFVTAA
jgi:hypothetical protein